MGRKPHALVSEFFSRGAKLHDSSNRYEHTCKLCGQNFPKGRVDSLLTHLMKYCKAISEENKQFVTAKYKEKLVHSKSGRSLLQPPPQHPHGFIADDGSMALNIGIANAAGTMGQAFPAATGSSAPQIVQSAAPAGYTEQQQQNVYNGAHEPDALNVLAEASRQVGASRADGEQQQQPQQQAPQQPQQPQQAQQAQQHQQQQQQQPQQPQEVQASQQTSPSEQQPQQQAPVPNQDTGEDSKAALVDPALSFSVGQTVPIGNNEQLQQLSTTEPEARSTSHLSFIAASANEIVPGDASMQTSTPQDNNGQPLVTSSDQMMNRYLYSGEVSGELQNDQVSRAAQQLTPVIPMTQPQQHQQPIAPAPPSNPFDANSQVQQQDQKHQQQQQHPTQQHATQLIPLGRPIAAQPNPTGAATQFMGSHPTPGFTRDKARRSQFSAQRRKEVQMVREMGACLRCRRLKKACSPGTPCVQCKAIRNPRVWVEYCVRESRNGSQSNPQTVQTTPTTTTFQEEDQDTQMSLQGPPPDPQMSAPPPEQQPPFDQQIGQPIGQQIEQQLEQQVEYKPTQEQLDQQTNQEPAQAVQQPT